jgi:hypothetical protein
MLFWFLAGFGLLVGGLIVLRWFASADPRTVAFAARAVGLGALGVAALALLISGRIGWVFGLLPFLLPLLLRRGAFSAASLFGSGSGKRQSSEVRTRYLDMRLDHQSHELDGEVLEGVHAGRALSALSEPELRDLYRLVLGNDRKSTRLLEAYLDRRCPDWRAAFRAADDGQDSEAAGDAATGTPPGGAMSRAEAYRVLGLQEGADEAEIREAYHRLISGVHPDKGGSSFLAAQVNRARDVLLAAAGRSAN